MKFKDLAKYCRSIDIDCGICEYKDECELFTSAIENASPAIIVEMVEDNKEFKDSFLDIPDNFDLFLANHCMDDMIIAEHMKYYCDKENVNKEVLIEAWKDLEKNNKVDIIIESIFTIFKYFFETKNIGKIIMSQYKSNAYFNEEIEFMDNTIRVCFDKIKKMVAMDDKYIDEVLKFYPFGDDERYRGKELLNNTQSSNNWIVGSYQHLDVKRIIF